MKKMAVDHIITPRGVNRREKMFRMGGMLGCSPAKLVGT
jgi:hypothetical protein